MVQHITFHEFLPIILGVKEMDKYDLVLQEKGYYKGIAKMLYSVHIDPIHISLPLVSLADLGGVCHIYIY